jgi:hypothetical protein
MLRRILRVFLLDADVFEEVGADSEANVQAVIIVTAVALLAAISSAIRSFILTLGFGAGNILIGATEGLVGDVIPFELPLFNPVSAFFSSLAGVYVAWLLWALVTWLIGEYVFKGDAGWGEMARIIGFSMSPRVLSALGFIPIPGLGLIVGLIGWGWAILAGFIGIRQGLQLSNGKTIITIVLSLIAVFLVNQFVIGPIVAWIF